VRLLLASIALVVSLPLAGVRGEPAAAAATTPADHDAVTPLLPGVPAALAAVRPTTAHLTGHAGPAAAHEAESAPIPVGDVRRGAVFCDDQARWCLRHSTTSSVP